MTADIHADDLVARVDLRAQLRMRREYHGLSCRQVSRRAKFAGLAVVAGLERTTSWELHRVMQWSRGLDRRLLLHITGFEVPAEDVKAAMLNALAARVESPSSEDLMHRRLVAHNLTRVRKAAMSRLEMARRCDVTEGAIGDWEELPEVSLLRSYQRYARALGGHLRLELAPVEAAVGMRR